MVRSEVVRETESRLDPEPCRFVDETILRSQANACEVVTVRTRDVEAWFDDKLPCSVKIPALVADWHAPDSIEKRESCLKIVESRRNG